VAVAELAGVDRNRQATAGRLGFRQRGARERERRREWERAAWAGSVWPTQTRALLGQ
jgi:hypothetical protein